MADYTISGNIRDVTPSGVPDGLIGWVSPAQDVVQDSGSNSAHLAPKQIEFDGDGGFSVDVVSGIYTLSVQFTGPSLAKEQRQTEPFEVVADVAIGSVTWRQVEVVTAEFAEQMYEVRDAVLAVPTTTDGLIAGRIADAASATYGELKASFARVVTPEQFNAVGDGTTDDTTAVQNALNAAYTLGGGTVRLAAGRIYRCNGQLTLPNDGQTFPGGRYIRITGEGNDGVLYPSGSTAVLDLRYSGSNAKLLCLPRGVLELDHFTLTDKGTSSTPFVLSINTIINAHDMSVIGNPSKSTTTCDQDVFVFGGSEAAAGGTVTKGFQGYGSSVQRVQFGRIRRAAYLRVWANSIVIRDNSISSSCGAAGSQGAIELDPTADAAGMTWGNVIAGNLIQMNGYTHGIKGIKAERNFFADNSFWDQPGGWVADYHFTTNSIGNVIRTGGPSGNNAKHYVVDGTSFANSIIGFYAPTGLNFGSDISGPVYLGARTPDRKVQAVAPVLLGGSPNVDGLQTGVVVQEQATTPAADGNRAFAVKRNPNATNPNIELFVVLNNGDVYALSPTGTASIRNAVFRLDGNGLTRYSGNNLTIDPGASGTTNFKRNGIRINSDGSGVTQYSGAGAPALAANLGDAYWRTDGGAGTWLYRCTTAGSATTGAWTAVA